MIIVLSRLLKHANQQLSLDTAEAERNISRLTQFKHIPAYLMDMMGGMFNMHFIDFWNCMPFDHSMNFHATFNAVKLV